MGESARSVIYLSFRKLYFSPSKLCLVTKIAPPPRDDSFFYGGGWWFGEILFWGEIKPPRFPKTLWIYGVWSKIVLGGQVQKLGKFRSHNSKQRVRPLEGDLLEGTSQDFGGEVTGLFFFAGPKSARVA